MAETHQLAQRNLSKIAETHAKQIDIPFYLSLNDEVFLFIPFLSKCTPESFQEFSDRTLQNHKNNQLSML